MTVIGSAEIKRRIIEENLITDYIDLETQLQPNGFDLCVENVFKFMEAGEIDFSNENRHIPKLTPIPLNEKGIWFLPLGAYAVGLKENINLPSDLRVEAEPIMGDSIHRSTVMRCGSIMASGRWDVGYSGMGRSLLIVHNPYGLRLHKNARIIQIKFYRVEDVDMVYDGEYQGETYNQLSSESDKLGSEGE